MHGALRNQHTSSICYLDKDIVEKPARTLKRAPRSNEAASDSNDFATASGNNFKKQVEC